MGTNLRLTFTAQKDVTLILEPFAEEVSLKLGDAVEITTTLANERWYGFTVIEEPTHLEVWCHLPYVIVNGMVVVDYL